MKGRIKILLCMLALLVIQGNLFATIPFKVSKEEEKNAFDFVPTQQILRSMHKCRRSWLPPELQNLPYAVYPSNPNYNLDRLNYNQRFQYFPKAIINPTTVAEAQYIVSVFKKYRLPFAVRSGRHCHEPGSLSNSYILDVQNFNAIIPDIANEQVYIGAGCRLGNVIQTLGALNYAIPTGTCPTVGVAGLTLGGGVGLLDRPYGLTCDSVKSITFLTADAEVVEVNATTYPDLFWALLGGGNGSYGLVLGFTFQMHYIPQATFYELIWKWDPQLVAPIMETWQEWIQTLPFNITSVLGIRHPSVLCSMQETAPDLVIRVIGLKIGPDPFTEWQIPFGQLNPQVNIFHGTYLETSRYWVAQPLQRYNKVKSRILFEPVGENVIADITQFFERLEEVNPRYLVYFNFEAFGGNIPQRQTAFFPRHAFAWWQQAYYWDCEDDAEGALALSQHFYRHIPSDVSKYCYANIVDYDLGRKYLKRYYGDHVNELIRIKRKYDPHNLFSWRQGIPTKKYRLTSRS